MSGTSLDGIDAVLVSARGRGLGLGSVSVLARASIELPERALLRRLASGEPIDAESISRAAYALGVSHAGVCRSLMSDLDTPSPELICVHGQTVFHRAPLSWQLLNPWPIALETGVPIVFDLRASDLSGGGQGAPLTPIADWVLYRHPEQSRVIINLGGFANATVLPAGCAPDAIRAGDLCPCNQVLDACARAALGQPFDPDGGNALLGSPNADACAELLSTQALPDRSLGTGDEAAEWVARWNTRLGPHELLATACEGVARAIVQGLADLLDTLETRPTTLALAGGAVANRALVDAITRASTGLAMGPVVTTDALVGRGTVPERGIAPGDREAAGFAVLGLMLADGQEIALPGVTGRRGPIPLSGAWIRTPNTPSPTDAARTRR